MPRGKHSSFWLDLFNFRCVGSKWRDFIAVSVHFVDKCGKRGQMSTSFLDVLIIHVTYLGVQDVCCVQCLKYGMLLV